MYEKERKQLVDKLSRKGITDAAVLDAINRVERHLFVAEAFLPRAYYDVALPIGMEQTISQPYTVAVMTSLLNVKKDYKILEIGTGSGYQAAILSAMGANVYSIERVFELYQRTLKLLEKMNYRVHMKCGDGTIGWSEFAPFDGIIVTAGGPEKIPDALKKQLVVGGKLVIPIGNRISQTLTVVTKLDDSEFTYEKIPEFTFVPLIGKEGWEKKQL